MSIRPSNCQSVRPIFLKALPVTADFKEDYTPDRLLENKAKWHKSCHLKFSSSEIENLKSLEKRKKEGDESRQSSKCQANKPPSKDSFIFCVKLAGKLHHCSSM